MRRSACARAGHVLFWHFRTKDGHLATGRGAMLVQSFALGLTQIAGSLAINACIVLGTGFLALWLARRPLWLRLQRWFMATVLGLLAVRLANDRARP